jgi:hypothetical protein
VAVKMRKVGGNTSTPNQVVGSKCWGFGDAAHRVDIAPDTRCRTASKRPVTWLGRYNKASSSTTPSRITTEEVKSRYDMTMEVFHVPSPRNPRGNVLGRFCRQLCASAVDVKPPCILVDRTFDGDLKSDRLREGVRVQVGFTLAVILVMGEGRTYYERAIKWKVVNNVLKMC